MENETKIEKQIDAKDIWDKDGDALDGDGVITPPERPDHRKGFPIPKVGRRTLMTVLSCLVTALLYEFPLGGRNACFACIGAVYGMGSQFREGFHNGFNRFVGTLIGGLVVIPFYWLYENTPFGIPSAFYLALGVFLVIYMNAAVGARFAIQPGTVIFFVVLFTQPEGSYVTYTIARIIDTGVGVLISLAISMLLPNKFDKEQGIDLISFPSALKDGFQAWYHANHYGTSPQLGEEERKKRRDERAKAAKKRKKKRH